MLSKGDEVSVLDEAVNGVVMSVNGDQVTIESTDGFVMTFFVNELIKVNNSSNLMNSIRSFNSGEIKKEKEIPKPRNFVKERKENEKSVFLNSICTSKNWFQTKEACLITTS